MTIAVVVLAAIGANVWAWWEELTPLTRRRCPHCAESRRYVRSHDVDLWFRLDEWLHRRHWLSGRLTHRFCTWQMDREHPWADDVYEPLVLVDDDTDYDTW